MRRLWLFLIAITLWVFPIEVNAQGIRDCPSMLGNGNSDRVLVLIQGLSTSASGMEDQSNYWTTVVNQLWDIYDQIVFFSYNSSNPFAYTADDTYLGLDHHVELLYQTLSGCRSNFGEVSFDLIGHSMGGVTAMEYIKQNGTTGYQGGWVKNVITLDSPVNGASQFGDYPFLDFPIKFFHSQSSRDMAQMARVRETTIDINLRFAALLRDSGVVVWTLTNRDDAAILPEDAIISGFGFYYELGRDLLAPGRSSEFWGHNQILRSREVAEDIAAILRRNGNLIEPIQFPETSSNPLQGVWVIDNPNEYTLLYGFGFYPNGKVVEMGHEGDTRGEYEYLSRSVVKLDVTVHFGGSYTRSNQYTFQVNGNSLTIEGEFVQVGSTFTRIDTLPQERFDQNTCAGTIPSQMLVGRPGRVSFTDGTSTRLRSDPTISSQVLMEMSEGHSFDVVDGPVCADGYTWWQLKERSRGQLGWSAEGADDQYFIWPFPLPTDYEFNFDTSDQAAEVEPTTATDSGNWIIPGETQSGFFTPQADNPQLWKVYLNGDERLGGCIVGSGDMKISVGVFDEGFTNQVLRSPGRRAEYHGNESWVASIDLHVFDPGVYIIAVFREWGDNNGYYIHLTLNPTSECYVMGLPPTPYSWELYPSQARQNYLASNDIREFYDFWEVELNAGDQVTICAATRSSDLLLELELSQLTTDILATSNRNSTQARLEAVVPEAGTYHIRAVGTAGRGNYVIQLAVNSPLDCTSLP
jgi:pimeloyl-ACP methyl ester carboxylesterase